MARSGMVMESLAGTLKNVFCETGLSFGKSSEFGRLLNDDGVGVALRRR